MKGDFDGDSPFTPPPSSAVPTVVIALAIGALAFAGYRAVDWWSAREAVEQASQEPAAKASGSTAMPQFRSEATAPAGAAPPTATRRVEAQPTWTRCEADGKVSYSDAGCAGAVQKSSSQTTQAALTTVPTSKASANATTIYRCKAYSGVVFWSSTHCNQKKALIDSMVEVPRGLSFEQQVLVAERSLPRQQTPVRQVQQQMVTSGAADKRGECDRLNAEIRAIDAITRQALSGPEQDWWRTKRQKARDQQFALRC